MGFYMNIIINSTAFRISIIVIVCIVLVKILDIIFKKIAKTKNQIHINFLRSCVQGVVILYGIYKCGTEFDSLDSFTKTLVTNSSLLVVVAGFAAKEVLNDILSGLSISMAKPFEINDRISLPTRNLSGVIEDISLRHTIIRTYTNNRVIIPNSIINKEIIENTHYKELISGHPLEIRIDYNSNIYKAIEIMQECIGDYKEYLDVRTQEQIESGEPKVKINCSDLGLDGITLKATIWTSSIDANFTACSELRLKLKEAFDANNINIACKTINAGNNKLEYKSAIIVP